ncbi:MAG: flagellar protein FliT [Gammaproteobacteria bacterium]|nr:flagellar protein FliT [Gammaproteobacteria bacterium]
MNPTHPHPGDPTAAVLDELTTVYRTMLQQAEAQSWDALMATAPRRRVLAEMLADLAPLDPAHRPRLERLQGLNAELERQTLAARGNLLSSLSRMKHGRKMHAAYTGRSNP